MRISDSLDHLDEIDRLRAALRTTGIIAREEALEEAARELDRRAGHVSGMPRMELREAAAAVRALKGP